MAVLLTDEQRQAIREWRDCGMTIAAIQEQYTKRFGRGISPGSIVKHGSLAAKHSPPAPKEAAKVQLLLPVVSPLEALLKKLVALMNADCIETILIAADGTATVRRCEEYRVGK